MFSFLNTIITAPFRQSQTYVPGWMTLLLPLAITMGVLIPIGILASEILHPTPPMWQHMWDTFLPHVIGNTLILACSVGIGSFFIGTGFAWLVTAYEFPGRRWFEHMLILPLAIPGFIMGFVFVAIFEFAGPVQSTLRDWFGTEKLAWFPDISSPGGLILVLTLVLYPYVYILARAAFREQTASTFEAAQMMGYSRLYTFFKLVLPLARPSLAAGTILAMIEAMTDYGTVSFFGFPTLSERVVVIWNTEFDTAKAAELAALLLIFAFIMILLEQLLRGKSRYFQLGKGNHLHRYHLQGRAKWAATGVCIVLISLAFGLPVIQLIRWAAEEIQNPSVGVWSNVYGEYVQNSFTLASIAALLTVSLALIIAYSVRTNFSHGKHPLPHFLTRMVTLGYAMPGAVIAAGVLTFINPIDGAITDFAEQHLGWAKPHYLLTGTITALTYAYIVRFMSVGYSSVESSMEKITPTMEQAARTLGAGPWRVLRRIHLPLVSLGIAAGTILVFVDVMKELPTTLLLRPFGMDTLALWTYFLSIEAFWQAAAIPALTILVVGLIPVFILMRVGTDQTHEQPNHSTGFRS